jgi:hypothetical protein
MKRSIRTGSASLLAVAAVLLYASTSAATTPPPSLSGEIFVAGSSLGAGALATSATCSQTSPSTIAFTASGISVGPYPGSFSESGFVTISNTPLGGFVDGLPLYQVSSVDVFFTINSTVGNVTGTKHLADPGVTALCDTFSSELFGNTGSTVTGFFRELNPANGFGESYDAFITTPGGAFEDTGIAGISLTDLSVSVLSGNPVVNSNTFNEAFISSSLTAVTSVGDATGGGQVSSNGNAVAFGFEARSQNGRLKGQCDVVDKAAGVKLHCSDVTAFVQVSPTEVKFFGNATINGTATTYEIDARDLADSGSGSDTFTVSTSAGYSAGGTLTAGNVQIHSS